MPTETFDEQWELEARRPPPTVHWDGVEKVHIMGICGSAMGAFAAMLKSRGYTVHGSDRGAYPPMSTQLKDMGIEVMEGYRASNLDWAPDVVIVGNVVRPTFEEAIALRKSGIPHCSLPQALHALFIRNTHSVVITGTHGKTTTTSMTAWLLHAAGKEPGFMVGGVTGNFGRSYRLGDGSTFVVEGDEYDTAYFDKGPKFLHYAPTTASINNVEFDHADIFADIDAVEAVFARFANLLPPTGRLIVPHLDGRIPHIIEGCRAPIWTFGLDPQADIHPKDVRIDETGIHFSLTLAAHPPQPTQLKMWGEHNLKNALTAAGLAYAAGASIEEICGALPNYCPPLQRQEQRGVAAGIPVFDDFAHHPTAIRETIRAMRTRFNDRRLVALFEVESNTSRRRVFQEAFAEALSQADVAWFCRPHAKDDNLPPEQRLDMNQLLESIRQRGTRTELVLDIDELAAAVVADSQPGKDVIIAMSGRNFHGIHAKILSGLDPGWNQ